MDKRTFLVITALAAPLVVLAALAQNTPQPKAPSPAASATKDPAGPKASPVPDILPSTDGKSSVTVVNVCSPIPASREVAIARLKQRLTEVETMSESEYQADRKKKMQARKRTANDICAGKPAADAE